MIKIVIILNEKGEVWFYTSDEVGDDAVLVNPGVKKEEWESEEKDKSVH